jgi:hypothetical protein
MPRPRSPERYDNLSPKYRDRLSRGGIGKESYVRGDSLKRARGHGLSLDELIQAAIAKKARDFSSSHKYRNDRAARNVLTNPKTKHAPKEAYLKKYIESDDIFSDPDFDWEDDEWAFLYYH